MSLTYATSIRGACHCADSNLYVDLGLTTHSDLGVKRTWPYRAAGKAAQTVASQKKGVIANSAVICEYAWNATGGALPEMVMMLNPVTGFGYTVDELAKVGDRIWYIKRALGNLCGATREDDRLPRRILEPHPEGVTSSLHLAVYPQFMSIGPMGKLRVEGLKNATVGFMNRFVYPNMDKLLTTMNKLPLFSLRRKKLEKGDPEEVRRKTVAFEEMLEEFYRLRDLDERGRPSRRRLEELGLEDVADVLHG
jgi:aldehyde:ferredoxin oxidoreductase